MPTYVAPWVALPGVTIMPTTVTDLTTRTTAP